jgi:hypothetical protein
MRLGHYRELSSIARALCGRGICFFSSGFAVLIFSLTLFFASSARAEYVVLKSGQRLVVTGYQLVGDSYKLQLPCGGSAEIAVSEVVSIEPEEVFHSAPRNPLLDTPYGNFIVAASKHHGVDADLIVSVITAESKFNPKAVSRKNARGLMQLLPETATRFGVKNIFDPQENIEAGTRYLRELLDRYNNDLTLTLAAYNAGPQRVELYKSVPPYRETLTYVRRVQQTYKARKSGSPARASSAQMDALLPNVFVQ